MHWKPGLSEYPYSTIVIFVIQQFECLEHYFLNVEQIWKASTSRDRKFWTYYSLVAQRRQYRWIYSGAILEDQQSCPQLSRQVVRPRCSRCWPVIFVSWALYSTIFRSSRGIRRVLCFRNPGFLEISDLNPTHEAWANCKAARVFDLWTHTYLPVWNVEILIGMMRLGIMEWPHSTAIYRYGWWCILMLVQMGCLGD